MIKVNFELERCEVVATATKVNCYDAEGLRMWVKYAGEENFVVYPIDELADSAIVDAAIEELNNVREDVGIHFDEEGNLYDIA